MDADGISITSAGSRDSSESLIYSVNVPPQHTRKRKPKKNALLAGFRVRVRFSVIDTWFQI